MQTMQSMERTFNNQDKLKLLRETFSTHVVLMWFGSNDRYQLNTIAKDNLTEIVTQAKQLLSMTPYRSLLS
jgi:hypothetical protein